MFYKKSRAKIGGKFKWFPRACSLFPNAASSRTDTVVCWEKVWSWWNLGNKSHILR